MVCVLVWTPIASATSFTLSFHSEQGDYVGQGLDVVLTNNDVGLFPNEVYDFNSDGLVDFVWFVSEGSGPTFFMLGVGTASAFNQNLGNLVAGFYPDAQRAPFAEDGHPGLDFGYDHRGCNTVTGNFTVLDAAFTGLSVDRFSVQFEQHCGNLEPALFGSFEIVPEPSTLLLLSLGLGVVGLRQRLRP
jgi:hypothetical protein